jgi:hypothetical protein
MPRIRFACVFALLTIGFALTATAQQPAIFLVANVGVGAQKIETLYLYATGKWSDAGEHIGPLSTQIQCYKALGFCDVASAIEVSGEATVDLTTFDILRWDGREMIAVDSSPICIANTLRVDLITKRITLSSSDKGVTKDPFCKGSDKLPTAVLWGEEEIVKDAIEKAKAKKHEPAAKPN